MEMSCGHVSLNDAEEFRIQKDPDRFLQPSQRNVTRNPVEFRSASPRSLLKSGSRPRSGVTLRLPQPTCQSPADEDTTNDQKSGRLSVSAIPSSRDSLQELQTLQNDSLSKHEILLAADLKPRGPAVASMFGTVLPKSIVSRPKPPIKLRSNLPEGQPKPTPVNPITAQKRVKQKPRVTYAPITKLRGFNVRSAEDRSDSTSSSDSLDSDDSNERTQHKKKKREANLKKKIRPDKNIEDGCDKNTTAQSIEKQPEMSGTSEKDLDWNYLQTSEEPSRSPPGFNAEHSSRTSSSDSLDSDDSNERTQRKKKKRKAYLKKKTFIRPDTIIDDGCNKNMTAQTIKELPEMSGPSLPAEKDLEWNYRQKSEEPSRSPPMLAVKPTVRSVDEIIASLRSPQVQTASDLMIKQLMESVLGLNYKSTSMNVDQMDEPHGLEIKNLEDESLTYLEVQNFLSANSPTHHKEPVGSSSSSDEGEEQIIQQPSLCIPEQDETLLPEDEMTEEEAKQVLKSSAQITISDIIHVKGDEVPLTRREAAKTSPPIPLLATWKPRDNILQNEIQTLPPWNGKSGFLTLPPQSPNSLEEWQRIAEYYVEGPQMELIAEQAHLIPRTVKLFWTPAPSKISAPLSHIQTLFSKYQSCLDEHEENEDFLMMEAESKLTEEEHVDLEDLEHLDREHLEQLDRVLFRRHSSLPDIHFPSSSVPVLKKTLSSSAPDISACGERKLHLSADFYTSMKEIALWKQRKFSSSEPDVVKPINTGEETNAEHLEPLLCFNLKNETLRTDKGKEFTSRKKQTQPRNTYKQVKKKQTKKKKGLMDPKKLKAILQELQQKPQTLIRSVSLERLPIECHSAFRLRRSSLPSCLDFTAFLRTHGDAHASQNLREWVRNIWNNWFDEVFPPSQASSDDGENNEIMHTVNPAPVKTEDMSWAGDLDLLPSLIVEDQSVSVQEVEEEIVHLTSLMEKLEKPSVFHCCRRGVLHRKLGNLNLALQDLEMAIKHEPQLLDAYWNRHLIFLLQGKTNEALDDLNFIIKYNKTNADAYLSKAEIYKQKKDYTLAIVNYTQALKCRPSDDDIYFRRAQMYELQSEFIIAMDDYAQCFLRNPTRTDALMKHGVYYFENRNWNGAVQDFTAVIKQDCNNAEARIYRGRAYTKLSLYTEAAEDFSAAIHLDPKNWMAFYYRGCLLRKCYPYQALQDFSISVLLYDDFENLNSFLHRGILYTDLGLWSEAASDFEQVLVLDRTIAVAHVNLGLICLLHRGQYSQAVVHFSAALKVDPLCVRAYICRAHAYRQQKDLFNALKDITRAIHLCPESPEPYIIRGQYLYEMKKYDLASFCIHHASEMAHVCLPVQQALVQSFRTQYSNAIECLVSANKERPSPGQIILLGKIQMKAKKNKDAAESFIQALELLGHTGGRSSYPERAEVFYLLGLCYMEQFKFLQALDALTSAIKARAGYCEAYYQRGLCRMSLQQASCLHDFNRALEINPNYLQAYLCRAAFYGFKKRYSKGILNCNAAIKVQPHSIRAYVYRGSLKYYIKAYKLAIQDLTKAIELDPSCSLLYYNRGVCYHQMKRFEEALKDYAIVLLLGGWKEVDVKVLVNRGLLYLELHDYINALEDFKAVVRKTPRDIKMLQAQGYCYHMLQQYEEAVETFTQALQLNPLSPEGHIGRGNAYMEYGHEEGLKCAKSDFVKALHLDPTCIAARICLGHNLQAQGLYQKAWNQFTIALDIDLQSFFSFEGRAIVNLQMGDTFAALQDMNAAIKLGVMEELLTNRGVIHQIMGKLQSAMKDYQAAIAANPNYSLAYFNAANLYLHNQQLPQARDYYSKAIELDPANESALLNRGITDMLLRDVQGALQDFQMVIDLCPVSCPAFYNRANLYNMLQEYELAEKDISQALLLQPGDPLMFKLRADIRGKMGLTKEAIEDYKRAIQLLQQKENPTGHS